MVKQVKGQKLAKSTDKKKFMQCKTLPWSKRKVYGRLCETHLDHIILHIKTNGLNSKSPPKKIAKSVTDVAKNQQKDTRTVSTPDIQLAHPA